jgi:nicotinamide mononucleotide transporter
METPTLDYAVPTARSNASSQIVLAGLTLATSVMAVVMVLYGMASWLEAVSFVTGAVCVWLTVKESVWNFPVGLLNVSTFFFVFWNAGLFGDAGLQVVYFALGLIGWWMWLYGGANRTALRIHRTSALEMTLVITAVAATAYLLWEILYHHTAGVAVWDATTTAMSLGCQWLLNRKRLESWIGWMMVNVIYIPLYCYKGLYLTGILYAVFLAMAVLGFLHWRKTYLAARASEPTPGGFCV